MQARPSVKQWLAAVRMLFDWLVSAGCSPVNPAAAVRGPKYVVQRGKTPVLAATEARQLLDSIDTGTVVGLCDRALIGLLVFTFARIGAALGMIVGDVYWQNRRLWVRLHEKGGKEHCMPCHHNLKSCLQDYIERAGLAGDPGGPLFHNTIRRTKVLTDRPMTQSDAWRMLQLRAQDTGIPTAVCKRTFRATGKTKMPHRRAFLPAFTLALIFLTWSPGLIGKMAAAGEQDSPDASTTAKPTSRSTPIKPGYGVTLPPEYLKQLQKQRLYNRAHGITMSMPTPTIQWYGPMGHAPRLPNGMLGWEFNGFYESFGCVPDPIGWMDGHPVLPGGGGAFPLIGRDMPSGNCRAKEGVAAIEETSQTPPGVQRLSNGELMRLLPDGTVALYGCLWPTAWTTDGRPVAYGRAARRYEITVLRADDPAVEERQKAIHCPKPLKPGQMSQQVLGEEAMIKYLRAHGQSQEAQQLEQSLAEQKKSEEEEEKLRQNRPENVWPEATPAPLP